VGGPNTADPVKVVHDGPGTHGAGGGGSGGGAVGQGKEDGAGGETRHGDIVDGKPKDKDLHNLTGHIRGVSVGKEKEIINGHIRGISAGGKSEKSTSGKSERSSNTAGSGRSPKEGKSPGMESSGTLLNGGNKSGKERKPSGPDDAWLDWEKEEMEELLGEIRGHLGESDFNTIWKREVSVLMWG